MAYYTIRNVNDHGLAWSKSYGWVDSDDYDVFSQEERDYLNLPDDGMWFTLY